MKYVSAIRGVASGLWLCAVFVGPVPAQAPVPAAPVYRCPGKPTLYTDQLSPKEAIEKGCRTIDDTPITVMQTVKPRAAAPAAPGSDSNRVSNADQRARDSERRTILETELRGAQDKLADLKKEFNNGEPERRGDERNYAKYQERVADLKSNITRKENDIVSIQREISKLPQ